MLPMLVLAFIIYKMLKFLWGYLMSKERIDEDDGYKEGWFGKAPQNEGDRVSEEDTSIRPFKVDVPDEVLSDLKSRLERTRLEDPVEDSRFNYGFNTVYLKEVIEYWKNKYDWRKEEQWLNQYPHFKTRIEGIDIHFIHVKPVLPEGRQLKVIPLMIVHGWPGSIVEFYKMIPLLTTPRPDSNFIFEVICPSIPGYGFSESAHRKGMTCRATARIFITLMERLGYRQFYVQGGDWGSAITTLMAKFYAPKVKGLHVNMYFFTPRSWALVKFLWYTLFPGLVNPREHDFLFPLKKKFSVLWEEAGYFHIQSTKPDTVGCGMADSPSGMAAYILEKFCFWTNPEHLKLQDGGLTKKFKMDELLTNVMLYWVNNNFTAAARYYKENMSDAHRGKHDGIPVRVPTALAVFPNELLMFPQTLLSQQIRNLVSYNIMPRGGHFGAMEEPQLLADDIWQFVSAVEK